MAYSDNVEFIRWIDKYVRQAVHDELNKMGVPRLYVNGVIDKTYQRNGKTYASVFLNGSNTSTPNIRVNPDISSSNLPHGTPVWVLNVNFNNLDMYVAMRKLA